MDRLNNKVAVVTGGSTGIGLAVAARFAQEGATVFMTGRREAELAAAVAEVGANAVGIPGDVTVQADLDRLFAAVAQHGHGLDIVVANAGGGEFAPLGDITHEHLSSTFDRNVGGTVFTVQGSITLLNENSSIVLVGSTSASNGTSAFSAYAASKAAVRSLGRTWAAELAGRGIRVNTLIPGSTNTPGLRGLASTADAERKMLEAMAAGVPLGRLGRPEEIASAALFLASEDSSFMTGGELFIDGGTEQL